MCFRDFIQWIILRLVDIYATVLFANSVNYNTAAFLLEFPRLFRF